MSKSFLFFFFTFAFLSVLKKIDEEIVDMSKLKVGEVPVSRVLPKTTTKKKKKQKKRQKPAAGSRSTFRGTAPLDSATDTEDSSGSDDNEQGMEVDDREENTTQAQDKIKVSYVTIQSRLEMAFSDPQVRLFYLKIKNKK